MRAKLYGFELSNPTVSARLMLDAKAIDFDLVGVPPGSQRIAMRMLGFRRGTVPGLRVDGRRIQGSTLISRALDQIQPEPPLFPADPEHRQAVVDAERWADDALQNAPRRPYRWVLARDRSLREQFGRTIEMPLPRLSAALSGPVASYYARVVSANDERVRAEVAALPSIIDRVDGLIRDGTIGGEHPNAADFQIAPSVRLLLTFADLRELIEGRPAAEHALRLVPDFPGEIPPFLPAAWLSPLKARRPPAD